jgi:hypothetical protein
MRPEPAPRSKNSAETPNAREIVGRENEIATGKWRSAEKKPGIFRFRAASRGAA